MDEMKELILKMLNDRLLELRDAQYHHKNSPGSIDKQISASYYGKISEVQLMIDEVEDINITKNNNQ